MKMEITVAEVFDLINEIKQQPDSLFEMIRTNVQETVGDLCITQQKMSRIK